MGRYVIERNFGAISDDDMLAAAVKSDAVASERFPEIVWEHSHIVVGDDGEVLTFCVYGAPNEEMIREHAARVRLAHDHADLRAARRRHAGRDPPPRGEPPAP